MKNLIQNRMFSLLLGFLVAFTALYTPGPQFKIDGEKQEIIVAASETDSDQDSRSTTVSDRDSQMIASSQVHINKELHKIKEIELSEDDQTHTFISRDVIKRLFVTLFRQFIAPNAP